ncbi:GM20830 [Drosophila sechellia]|uniref:GM20830 n=1 Tax=Drosophila sechellia TaxID=7238 RepID=B4IN16_DROSE|nr:GM20830 [Drosophila sechellia]
MRNLKELFKRLRAANLKVNADKCKFFRKELQYLGRRVTNQGIGTDPEKVAAIAQLKPPGNVKELRQYLGVASWYRRFVPDFATLVQPLNALLKRGKMEMGRRPPSRIPGRQGQTGRRPDSGVPRLHENNAERSGEELLGNGKGMFSNSMGGQEVETDLEGYHFKVITDHMALKWLNNIESPSGRIARWALELQQYDFEISYRKGQLNIVADALSRQPLQETRRRVSVEDDGQPREQQECRWLEEMQRKVKQQPEKFPDYLVEDGKLYRHIPHRAGNE